MQSKKGVEISSTAFILCAIYKKSVLPGSTLFYL